MTRYGTPLVHAEVEDATRWRCCSGCMARDLALEARHRIGDAGERLCEELDRHQLAELDALGAIHHAHAACAETLIEPIELGDSRPELRVAQVQVISVTLTVCAHTSGTSRSWQRM